MSDFDAVRLEFMALRRCFVQNRIGIVDVNQDLPSRKSIKG